jgi:hypothetical protein
VRGPPRRRRVVGDPAHRWQQTRKLNATRDGLRWAERPRACLTLTKPTRGRQPSGEPFVQHCCLPVPPTTRSLPLPTHPPSPPSARAHPARRHRRTSRTLPPHTSTIAPACSCGSSWAASSQPVGLASGGKRPVAVVRSSPRRRIAESPPVRRPSMCEWPALPRFRDQAIGQFRSYGQLGDLSIANRRRSSAPRHERRSSGRARGFAGTRPAS